MRYPRFFFKKLVNDKNNFCGFLATETWSFNGLNFIFSE